MCRRHYPGGNRPVSRGSLPGRSAAFPFGPRGRWASYRLSSSLGRLHLFPASCPFRVSRIVRGPSATVLQPMSLRPCTALAATGWSDSCRAGLAPARKARLSTAHAKNHVTSIGTARSAIPVVVRDSAVPCRESGKTGCEWRDSRARVLLAAGGRGGEPRPLGDGSQRQDRRGLHRAALGLHTRRDIVRFALESRTPAGRGRAVEEAPSFLAARENTPTAWGCFPSRIGGSSRY